MANRRAPLTEKQLRKTKENLLQSITEQKRKGGVPSEPGLEADPTGGARDAEAWLDPILRRVEIGHERDRDRDMFRVEEESLVPDGRFVDTKESAGTYEWNLRTDEVKRTDGKKPDGDPRSMIADFIHSLYQIPEWRDQYMRIGQMCTAHFKPFRFCVRCERREAAARRLTAMAIHKFRKQKKIVLS